MEKILLINPIGSRRKKRAPIKSRRKNPAAKRSAATMAKRKARRTAAQKAATRRLVALNRSRRKAPAKRRRNPLASKAAAYRAVPTIARNPIRRRKRRASVAGVARPRRRIRRNPLGRGIVNSLVMPAVTATAGALVLDLAWGYLPIPATLKAGPLRHVAKAAGAVGLAVLGGKVVKKSTADAMGLGALTVVLHDAAKEAIAKFAPTVKLGDMGMYVNGLGYYSPAMPADGGFNSGGALPSPGASLAGVGMYVNGYSGNGLETEAGYVYD